MDLNKVYNIDVLKGLNMLDDDSIDLVVTSPPYFNAREYSQFSNYDDYLNWIEEVFNRLYNKMKDGRMVVVNISPVIEPRLNRSSESKRYAIPFHLVSIMEKIGYKFLEDIIWEKPNPSVKNRNASFFKYRKPVAYKPNIVHEYVLVFQKPSNYLIDKILKDNKEKVENSLVEGDYEKTSIWKISPRGNKYHSAVYPKELSSKIIEYYSFKDDIVLDTFMGSGTTALSCIDLNRNYIGFELNEDYYNLILENIGKK